MAPPFALIVMGVAGSGKTTVAEGLAHRLGWPCRDADSFHPPANVAKMSRGEALTDADRAPWLDAIGAYLDAALAGGGHAIVTCSSLRRSYRDRLIAGRAGVHFVHLVGSRELIGSRMAKRSGHFMPLALLDSQFATLEEPGPDEPVLAVPVSLSPDEEVERIVVELGLEASGESRA